MWVMNYNIDDHEYDDDVDDDDDDDDDDGDFVDDNANVSGEWFICLILSVALTRS